MVQRRRSADLPADTGIFVNDILDAVPIDKYFELFKPGAGGEGGFIRIGMNFTKALKDRSNSAGARVRSAPLCALSVVVLQFCVQAGDSLRALMSAAMAGFHCQ